METKTRKGKVRFCVHWTLLSTAGAAIGSTFGIIFFILILQAFDIPEEESGTILQNMIGLIVCTSVVGISIGFMQWYVLQKAFRVSRAWLYSLVIGSIIAEILFGIIYWRTDIVESFGEGNLLGGAIILTTIMLFIGFVQLPLLRRHYANSGYWILASILPGAIIISLIAIFHGQDLDWIMPAIVGFFMYFIGSGATLMWILKPKEIKS